MPASGNRGQPVLTPLVLVTPIAALLVVLPVMGPGAALIAAGLGLASAILVGAPALAFVLARGLRGLWPTTLFGAVVGMIPLLLWGASVSLLDGRLESPTVAFLAFQGLAALAGAATGAVYFHLHRGDSLSRLGLLWRIGLSLLAATLVPAAVTAWPTDAWPKHRERREVVRLSWEYGAAVDETNAREIRVWRANRPACVASIYLPLLARYLDAVHPAEVEAEIFRVSRVNRGESVRLVRLGDVEIHGPITFVQGCRVW